MNRAQELALTQAISFSSLLKIDRSAAVEITQVARDSQCDLILLGYKKEEDPLENSVIHRVISLQLCDVAILKSDKGFAGPFERVLVLGMREEPWLQSFFLGTIAQQVAGQVQCPTLLVKAYAAEKSRLRRLLGVESKS